MMGSAVTSAALHGWSTELQSMKAYVFPRQG